VERLDATTLQVGSNVYVCILLCIHSKKSKKIYPTLFLFAPPLSTKKSFSFCRIFCNMRIQPVTPKCLVKFVPLPYDGPKINTTGYDEHRSTRPNWDSAIGGP